MIIVETITVEEEETTTVEEAKIIAETTIIIVAEETIEALVVMDLKTEAISIAKAAEIIILAVAFLIETAVEEEIDKATTITTIEMDVLLVVMVNVEALLPLQVEEINHNSQNNLKKLMDSKLEEERRKQSILDQLETFQEMNHKVTLINSQVPNLHNLQRNLGIELLNLLRTQLPTRLLN